MQNAVQDFLDACTGWLCDNYSLSIRYLGGPIDTGHELWSAAITLVPLPAVRDYRLRVVRPGLVAGQIQEEGVSANRALQLITAAAEGSIAVHDMTLKLPHDVALRRQSTTRQRNPWYDPLRLQVFGGTPAALSADLLAQIDHTLRTHELPFDGLTDLGRWLDLSIPEQGHGSSAVSITVSPPVGIIFNRCRLSANRLRIALEAHPGLDIKSIGLAVRLEPGGGLAGRHQVAERIQWGGVSNGRREGVVDIDGAVADSALAMLTLGPVTVQRQWFVDPERAANHRLLAVQQFDRDLKMIKQGLLESADGARFEAAVAALLFLLGFAAAVQLETDSPDLVVSTPARRLLLMECTVKVSDIAAKIGKLVDRRESLSKALQNGNHPLDVTAVLVCRQPRDQMVAHSDLLRANRVILMAGEEISRALDRVRSPGDADAFLREVREDLSGAHQLGDGDVAS